MIYHHHHCQINFWMLMKNEFTLNVLRSVSSDVLYKDDKNCVTKGSGLRRGPAKLLNE